KEGARAGSSTLYKLRDAAGEVIRQCVLRQSRGGRATSLGGDDNLVLEVGRYIAAGPLGQNIQCAGPGIDEVDCGDILAGMQVSKEREKFGPRSDPEKDITIPLAVASSKHSMSRFATVMLTG
ncbi:MAG: hypothetical protein Q9222_005227, partial [Ikaeria aurantiellina]